MNAYNTKTGSNQTDYEKTQNLMKYFFAYDYMKFQQLIKASEKAFTGKNIFTQSAKFTRDFPKKRNKRNSNLRTFTRRKTNRSPNNITDKSTTYKTDKTIDEHSFIQEELREIKTSQKETNSKIELLIKHLKAENKLQDCSYSVDNFTLEFPAQSNNKQIFDYFSFKIKPDMSLSSMNGNDIKTEERNSLNSNYKKKLGHSPDRLLTHKFFEDTDQYNLMGVKTFINAEATNPFCMTNKSDSDIALMNKNALDSIFRSDKKIDEEVQSALDLDKHLNYDISISIAKFSEREVQSEKVIKRRVMNINHNNNINTHVHNFQISEEENNSSNCNYSCNINSSAQNPLKTMNTINTDNITLRSNTNNTISDNNDTVSLSSSKMNVESSQDKFKKVRGFNFKNNINTKKYNKPLLSSNSGVAFGRDKETPMKSNGGDSNNNNKTNESNEKFESNINTTESMNVFNSSPNMNTNVNKSSNLEERVKLKKINFNNNIRKFLRQDLNNANGVNGNLTNLTHGNINLLLKEREKQYAVEIEEVESEPISIGDLKCKDE